MITIPRYNGAALGKFQRAGRLCTLCEHGLQKNLHQTGYAKENNIKKTDVKKSDAIQKKAPMWLAS